MSRRSSRLESSGYYDSEGEPSISYKETLYRIFRRRKTNFHPNNGESTSSINDDSMSNENSISNRDVNSDSNDNGNSYRNSYSISNSYSYTYENSNNYRNSYSNSYSYRYSNKDTNRNTIGNRDTNRSTIDNRDTNRNTIGNRDNNSDRNSNSRSPTTSKLKMLLIILSLCFGFVFLIPSLSTNFLDSGPSESPAPTTIPNTDLNSGCEVMAQNLRELQDELLRLKKYLLPPVGTLPNYALETQGASILFHQTSKTYTQKAGLTFFGIPIWQSSENPRTVIQGHSPLVPGRCWPFAGGRGQLFIALSHRVAVSHVTLGHISKNLSPTGSISSAPKMFSVYGMETLHDDGTQLGTFLYDQDGDPIQTFTLPDHKKGVFAFIKLQVESNWGHPDFTCLYSFRVHGNLVD